MKRSSTRGAALIETAVALPLLLVVVLGAVDFGRIAYLSILVSSAANAGARYGANSADNAGNINAIRNAALNDLGTIGTGRAPTVTVERFCTCAPSDSAWTCDATPCPSIGGYSTQPRMFVKVQVQSTFDTLFVYPGLPRTVPVTRVAQIRAQ